MPDAYWCAPNTGPCLLGVRAADNFGTFPQDRSAFTHGMPYIQLSDKQYPLKVGETTVGANGADIVVAGRAGAGIQAKLQTGSDNTVVIRRASPAASSPTRALDRPRPS